MQTAKSLFCSYHLLFSSHGSLSNLRWTWRSPCLVRGRIRRSRCLCSGCLWSVFRCCWKPCQVTLTRSQRTPFRPWTSSHGTCHPWGTVSQLFISTCGDANTAVLFNGLCHVSSWSNQKSACAGNELTLSLLVFLCDKTKTFTTVCSFKLRTCWVFIPVSLLN